MDISWINGFHLIQTAPDRRSPKAERPPWLRSKGNFLQMTKTIILTLSCLVPMVSVERSPALNFALDHFHYKHIPDPLTGCSFPPAIKISSDNSQKQSVGAESRHMEQQEETLLQNGPEDGWLQMWRRGEHISCAAAPSGSGAAKLCQLFCEERADDTETQID